MFYAPAMRRIHERIVGDAGLVRRRWRTVLSGKALGVSTRSNPEYARVPLEYHEAIVGHAGLARRRWRTVPSECP